MCTFTVLNTWLDMLCLSKGGNEELLAVAPGAAPTRPIVRRRRETDVAPGAEVGGVSAVAGVDVVHAKDLVRLLGEICNSTFALKNPPTILLELPCGFFLKPLNNILHPDNG